MLPIRIVLPGIFLIIALFCGCIVDGTGISCTGMAINPGGPMKPVVLYVQGTGTTDCLNGEDCIPAASTSARFTKSPAGYYNASVPRGSGTLPYLRNTTHTPVSNFGSRTGTGLVTKNGTVHWIDISDGFYGIITDDGDHYIPATLPPAFQQDGIRVTFTGVTTPISPSIRMWGTPLRVLSIDRIPDTSGTIETTGTVTWVPLEGGFFGIIGDDGTQYDPVNLPEEYARDGLRISFTAAENGDVVSYHMWGTIVTLTRCSPLSGTGVHDSRMLVEFHRTGGIAGFDDHMVIYTNGTVHVDRRDVSDRFSNTYTLSPTQLRDLETLFGNSGFMSLSQDTLPSNDWAFAADYFIYTIEYKGHRIEAPELSIPDSMQPLIERLTEIMYHEDA